jgi:hypothetical protein
MELSSTKREHIRVIVRIRPDKDRSDGTQDGTPQAPAGMGKMKTVSAWNLKESAQSIPPVTNTLSLPSGKSTKGSKKQTVTSSDNETLVSKSGISFDENSITVLKPSGPTRETDKIFNVNHVYADDSTQEDVYESVADFVNDSVNGFSVSIFAYGAAKSGKTFTMMGTKFDYGIIPRAIDDIFKAIDMKTQNAPDSYYYVEISYLELYNNNFRNLLKNMPKEQFSNILTTNTHKNSTKNDNDDDDDVYVVEHEDDLFSLPDSIYNEITPTTNTTTTTTTPNLQQILSSKSTKPTNITSKSTKASKLNEKEKIPTENIVIHESKSLGVFVTNSGGGNSIASIRLPVASSEEAMRYFLHGSRVRANRVTPQSNYISSRWALVFDVFIYFPVFIVVSMMVCENDVFA